jgi:hypothetical protein
MCSTPDITQEKGGPVAFRKQAPGLTKIGQGYRAVAWLIQPCFQIRPLRNSN